MSFKRMLWSSALMVGAPTSLAVAATNVGGPIFSNTTWTLAGSPYIVTNSIIVGADATLTINPGVVVKVNNGLGIQVGSPEGFGAGKLVAVGTAGQPILFTSNDAVPIPGKWNNVLFTDLAGDAVYNGSGVYQSGSIIEHAIVEFAGGGTASTGSVTVVSSSPFLNFVEVRKSNRSGIRVDGASAPALRITNCDVHDCTAVSQDGGGLYLINGQTHFISGNNFHNNSSSNGGGIYLQNSNGVSVSGNTFMSNSSSGGGGFYGTNVATLLFQNNTSSSNSSGNFGGMYVDGNFIQLLTNTFNGNTVGGSYGGVYCASSNSFITGNIITNNTAAGSYGGSYLTGNNQQITGNQWTGNQAAGRAGVHVDGTAVTFSSNMVKNNNAVGASSDIGGLEAQGSNGTYSGNTVQGNNCQRTAGGVYVLGTGHVFANNLIDDNFAGSVGGGVYVDASNTTWTKNTVSNNEASSSGGGVYVNGQGTSFDGPSDLSTCNSFSGNIAPNGSAMYNNLRYADSGVGNVDAAYVCWGTNDPAAIAASLYDYFDNAGKGLILAAPLVGGPIATNTTWTLAGSPYTVMQSVLVGNGATLTIQPGVVVRFGAATGLTIGSGPFGPGTLIARGTPAQPITFTTSLNPPFAVGSWKDIQFSSSAVDAAYDGFGGYVSGSVLEHAIVEWGGGGNVSSGGITVVSSSPFLNFVEVREANRSGIRVDGASAPALRITNCNVHDCTATSQDGGGLYLINGQSHFIGTNNFHNNTASNGGGIYLQNATGVSVTGNTLNSNSTSGGGGFYGTNVANLLFQNNTASSNSASNFGGMYVDGNAIQILTNTFNGNTVGGSYGGLYCSSSNSFITNNIVTNNTAAGSYGGSYLTGDNQQISGNDWTGNKAASRGGVHVDGTSVTFSNNTVEGNQAIGASSDVGGLEAQGSTGVYSGNTIKSNICQRNAGGVYLLGNGHSFANNEIDDNFAGNAGGGAYIDATNTAWTHNLLTNNTATLKGGAIYNNATGTNIAGNSVTGVYNTVIGNQATNGSAIFHNVPNGGTGNLPAQFVCWGTNDQGVVQGELWDFFDNSSLGIVLTFPLVTDCGLANPCPADLSGDQVVGPADLGILLGQWGVGGSGDLDGNGIVGSSDLGILLGAWGACP